MKKNVKGVAPAEFARRFKKAQAGARRAIRSCLESPTEEAVHDARVALRKLRVSVSLMPKEYRKDSRLKKAMRRVKQFYSLCADIRDCDIEAKALARFHDVPGIKAVLLELARRRESRLKEAIATGRSLRRLSLPKPPRGFDGRIQRRLVKLVSREASSVNGLGRVVARNEKNVRELHRLRMKCRTLFYLLGFARPTPQTKKAAKELDELRGILGSIRDDDIVVGLLRKRSGVPSVQQVSAHFETARRRKYASFLARQGKNGDDAPLSRVLGFLGQGSSSSSWSPSRG